ncbi:hypothetical protein Bca52824_072755 [Brassica carinata]|uniref:No apical meristem-associated C-terminal domain-containing protein n=1 Tax=Brassica carinata TaxID=52824 RepID=A0A8X7Q8J9_BRACI|nr:hypothetical protein Bca52824_072755 [Brassica carinata]
MDYPHNNTSKFVDLLNSQQEPIFAFSQDSVSLSSSQASKGHGKKKMAEGKEKQSRMTFSEFQSMWSLKKEDLSQKEKLSKIKLLDSLLAKQEPLADYEEALKKKLINELLA